VTNQIKQQNLLLGCAIALSYLLSNQPVYAVPITQPKLENTQIAQTITVNGIQLIGNTVLTPEELAPILLPIQGKAINLEQVKTAAEAITQLYISKGYITSQAKFDAQDPQSVVNGIAQIRTVEGEIERVDIIGTTQTNPDYVRSRVNLGITKPFKVNLIEDQLRLIRSDPIFRNVTSSLKPSASEGKSLLVIRVEEANQLGGSVSFDNYSSVSVGSERMGANLSYRNFTGNGDLLAASYYRSTTGGSNVYDFSYSFPINPMNGTIAIRYAPSNSRITDPAFALLNIKGANSLFDIVYSQPLIRGSREEFALSFGFNYQTGQTFLFENLATPFGIGPDADGVSTTSVFRFGQDYTLRDPDGTWALRSQFNLGTGLFGATFVTTPNAGFFSWLGQLQRVQVFGSDALLIASLDSQLSANPLLSSQQFIIGGGQSLRGFRQNALSGDNGIRMSLETRLTAMRDESTKRSLLQINPFIDLGAIWNRGDNPTPSPSQNFLAAAGLSVITESIERLILRIDFAIPFVNLQGRGNNLQDTSIYFTTNYSF
jgi:hemolysin activation/secretion protein